MRICLLRRADNVEKQRFMPAGGGFPPEMTSREMMI